VLVVEDHEDTRDMFAWCMRAAGWQVDTAGNGLEALVAAAGTHPDVIVMDLDLPVLDGIDAARRLKADDATAAIPVVACTAFTRQLHDRIYEAGFEALVPKPCLPEHLRELVEQVLAEHVH
jgi:two-component system cell cycle response regulator DivK